VHPEAVTGNVDTIMEGDLCFGVKGFVVTLCLALTPDMWMRKHRTY